MFRPKISIIIDNFNYAAYVGAAVESALSQTYRDVETIVVDDGSTDGSREVLKKFEGRVRLIFKENGGQSSAFNAGFRIASGELIAFLDSDDVLFPDAIETVVRDWEPGVVKMQFPLQVLGPEGATGFTMPRAQLSEGDVLGQLLRTGRYVTSPTSGNGNSMTSAVLGEGVDLRKLEKLMRHAFMEKGLIERLARERGLKVSSSLVVSHWMHLKLSLSVYRLKNAPGMGRTKALLRSASAMAYSVVRSDELSLFVKCQHIVWALGVAVLPEAAARRFIRVAFDHAPQSRLMGLLRRA